MPASEYRDYDPLLDGKQQKSWILVGLIISLALHLLLCAYFYRTKFGLNDAVLVSQRPPPTFKLRNVEVNPGVDKPSVDQTNPAAKPDPDKTDQQLPDQKKSFDSLLEEVHATTALPDDTQDVLPDKPRTDPDATSALTEIERSAQVLSKSPNAAREQSMLNDSATSGRPLPALSGTDLATSTTIKRPNSFTSKVQADSAGPSKRGNLGFSDLDSLLAQKGPLGSGTAIRMPDDQLFQYNSADLQGNSVEQLRKLGTLIKRNPKATFSVEGYTDSFGDFNYNIDLSQRRADGVKEYLVNVMGINPEQIDARGYGARKFLVTPRPVMDPAAEQAEIARQQANRRVVIVVHTSGN
ncbi:MAG: OmpA family protein [Verrucomicrobiota bacterium]|nr:OmpA family protein [Verrucomicrobiota bacterium]